MNLRYHNENRAGNFADLHKHWVLELLLKQFQESSQIERDAPEMAALLDGKLSVKYQEGISAETAL